MYHISGIILVSAIHPGSKETKDNAVERVGSSRNVTAVDTLLDLARNLFPPNLVQVCYLFIKVKVSLMYKLIWIVHIMTNQATFQKSLC